MKLQMFTRSNAISELLLTLCGLLSLTNLTLSRRKDTKYIGFKIVSCLQYTFWHLSNSISDQKFACEEKINLRKMKGI